MANGGKVRTPPDESGGGPYRTTPGVSRLPGNQMPEARLGFAIAAIDHCFEVEAGGVHQDRVRRRLQRRDGPLGVVLVAAALVGEHLLQRDGQALFRQLVMPPPRARLVTRGEEELHLRVGKDDGADVAPLEDGAARRVQAELALETELASQLAGDRALARSGGSVDGDDGRGHAAEIAFSPQRSKLRRPQASAFRLEKPTARPTATRPRQPRSSRARDATARDQSAAA